ncbi:MAG: hypothetical protein KJ622_16715 [Alphaproteobacteria bacterium]|nr:hypothetical protein [Alphaproteobacteria bacterium]
MRFTPAFMVLEELDSAGEVGRALGWGISAEVQKPVQRRVKVLTENDLKQAYDEGQEAGYLTATAEFEVVLAQRDAEARARLAEVEQEFAQNCGARLAEDLTTAIQEIRKELADEAAKSVLPLIDSRLRAIAVEDLAECIMEVGNGGGVGELRLKGPSALIGAMEQQLPEGWNVTATVDEGAVELTAQIDSSLFRTQIENWVKRVEEAAP